MITTRKLQSLLLITAASFVSCDKDNVEVNSNGKRLVEIGEWKLVTLKVGPSEIPLDPCKTDNVFTFGESNQFTMDEGPTKCDAGDEQMQTGEWLLASDDTTLTLTLDGTTKLTRIVELTDTKLILIYSVGPLDYTERYEPK